MYAKRVLLTTPVPTNEAEILVVPVFPIVSCLPASAVVIAVDRGLFASDVLSTFVNPTDVFVSPFTVVPVKSTVPVNVGEFVKA